MVLNIGEEGLFKFVAGCKIPTDVSLRVASVNPIGELVSMGVDMAMHYELSGLTTLSDDLADDRLVYRLVSSSGWWYCPINALASVPSITHKGYVRQIIGIDLGDLPIDEDLTLLKQELTLAVESAIGVSPKQVLETSQGKKYSVSEIEHQSRLVQRKGIMSITNTISARLKRTTDMLNEANKTIKLLTEKLLG